MRLGEYFWYIFLSVRFFTSLLCSTQLFVHTILLKTHQSHGVQNVDERGKDLPVEVGGEEGAEGREKDDDGHADGQVEPRLRLHPALGHQLAPVEA